MHEIVFISEGFLHIQDVWMKRAPSWKFSKYKQLWNQKCNPETYILVLFDLIKAKPSSLIDLLFLLQRLILQSLHIFNLQLLLLFYQCLFKLLLNNLGCWFFTMLFFYSTISCSCRFQCSCSCNKRNWGTWFPAEPPITLTCNMF